MTSEYQYGLRMPNGAILDIRDYAAKGFLDGSVKLGYSETLVRRPVGEWEEVDVAHRTRP